MTNVIKRITRFQTGMDNDAICKSLEIEFKNVIDTINKLNGSYNSATKTIDVSPSVSIGTGNTYSKLVAYGDGNTNIFVLTSKPIVIYVNGVAQFETKNYTLVNLVVYFFITPQLGDIIWGQFTA